MNETPDYAHAQKLSDATAVLSVLVASHAGSATAEIKTQLNDLISAQVVAVQSLQTAMSKE